MNKRIKNEWESKTGQKIVRGNPNIRAKLEEIAAIVAESVVADSVPKGMQDRLL